MSAIQTIPPVLVRLAALSLVNARAGDGCPADACAYVPHVRVYVRGCVRQLAWGRECAYGARRCSCADGCAFPPGECVDECVFP